MGRAADPDDLRVEGHPRRGPGTSRADRNHPPDARLRRGELERTGSCRRAIPATRFPKCRSCPLFDPEWAYESEGMSRRPMLEIALGVGDDPDPVVPDTIPEEWLRDPPPD